MYLSREIPGMHSAEQTYWQLISGGDKKAYEQVFRDHYTALCRYALPILRDKDECEEVVQTVYYNLWSKRESLQITGSVKSYLYRAVHNECLNRIKHQKVRQAYAADYMAVTPGHDDSHAAIEAKELNKQIHAAIDSLPEQCGHVFRLSRFQQLRYSEIAEQLNISVKTVENHMGKALRILRENLKDFLPMLAGLIFIWLSRK